MVNGNTYRAMITNCLWPQIAQMDLDNIWSQQGGATCIISSETIILLRPRLENRVFSRSGDINWPPRSCDLTALDFYLWGAVEDRYYANSPATIHDLKQNIKSANREMKPETIENVLKNWVQRLGYCKASRGGHLNYVIFHV